MKNLKQVLALGMAFSLTMSTMAGAAFTDQADIKATEAVDMLSALGVIKGYEDGSFKPEGTVTRAEAAKMIYTIRNGGNDDASSWAGLPTTFTDLNGYGWAEGYIKYCQSMGIIAGKSATSFDPGAKVTGVELAKMMLVTLGYNAEKAGLTGAAWSNKTLGLAGENALLDDVNTDLAAGMPRQYAAQLIYNAVLAPTVVLRDGEYTNQKLVGGANETIGQKYMSLSSDVATLTGIDGENMNVTVLANTNSYHADGPQTFTKLDKDYSAFIGQTVKVLFKDGKTNEVMGVYATGDNEAYTIDAYDVEVDGTKIKFGGNSYNVETADANGLITYIDGVAQTGTDKYTVAELAAMNTSTSKLTLVDADGNGKIDTVFEKTNKVAKVTYVSSTQIVAGGVTYKTADDKIAEGLAKDDYVLITKNLYNKNNDIVKADVVTAKIEGSKAAANGNPKQYKVNGTWYNVVSDSVAVGDNAEIVIVNGVIYDAKKVSGSTTGEPSIVMGLTQGTGLDSNKFKYMKTDGTVAVAEFEMESGVYAANKVYSYEMDGEKFKLTALSDAETADTEDYKKIADANTYVKYDTTTNWTTGKTPTMLGANASGGNDVSIADTAKVIIVYGEKSKVVTGKQFKALTFNSNQFNADTQAVAAYTSTVDGLKRVSLMYVVAKAEPTGFNTNDGYGYVLETPYSVADSYYEFKLWTNGEIVTVKTKTADIAKGSVIGYSSIDDKNVVNDVKDYGVSDAKGLKLGALVGVNADKTKVVFAGEADYIKLASNVKVMYVDSKADKVESIGVAGDVSALDSYIVEDVQGVYKNNVKYITNGDEIVMMVVDVKGSIVLDATDMHTVTLTKTADRLSSMTATNESGDVISTGVTKVAKGEQVNVTLTGAATAGQVTVTLTNAKFVSDGKTTSDFTIADNGTATFTVIADGVGDVTVTATNKG